MGDGVTIHVGDCLDVMRSLEANSIDSIVTDPPYGLGFMGKEWDHGVPGTEFWIEMLRVAKPGTHLLAFGGSRTYHRMACAIEDAGWEMRDCIMWIYGSGFPKSHNGPWGGTALKPAHEPIVVARKPLIGTVAANVAAHGTGALNISGCRVAAAGEQLRIGVGAIQARHDESVARASNGMKPGPRGGGTAGRWPANLIHDGSPEVLAAFPNAPGQIARAKTDGLDSGNAVLGRLRNVTTNPDARGDIGSASRFFYCAKATRKDRNDGCEGLPTRRNGMVSNNSGQHITRRDGDAPQPSANHHPTVKPTELMRYLCRLITPTRGKVLDPFMGSGSTGRGALLEGFDFVGIELDEDYARIARARIGAVQLRLPLGDVA